MHKREAAFTTKFNHWARKNVRAPAVFEIKQTSAALPFARVEPHQRRALMAALSAEPFAYKIPDTGPAHRPFDTVLFGYMDAYVVVSFGKEFYGIGVELFLEEEKRSKRKSLTEERAREIAHFRGNFSRK